MNFVIPQAIIKRNQKVRFGMTRNTECTYMQITILIQSRIARGNDDIIREIFGGGVRAPL